MSRREDAIKLADAIVADADGDVERAYTQATETGGYEWWTVVALAAGVDFPLADERRVVLTVLKDRRNNPDPFASFPS
jgi:hypothetical protein